MSRAVAAFCILLPVLQAAPPAAKASRLWSLQPVVRPDPPGQSRNPIDAFLTARFREKGITPQGPADKLTLLRRVTLDLTGLPPTAAEQQAFLADTSPNAYDKVVDRLLASEQHGVRWARRWLDVLRYADLDGLDGSVMPAAPGIYRWRDWMIHALNDDMPYDQFVRAQILGNRYRTVTSVGATGHRSRAEANPQDQFALGFLARSAITGGDRDQDIAINAVETISSAFLGMTVACAKCHDHRFDPISQNDYYAMKALFDPLVLRKVVLATPQEVYDKGREMEAWRVQKEASDKKIDALTAPYHDRLYEERVQLLPPDVQAIVRKPERKRTVAEQKIADDYFPVLRIDPPKIREIMPPDAAKEYDALLKEAGKIKRPFDLPAHWIVEEDPARLQAASYILTSGDPARPEKNRPVKPGFPFQPEDTDFREGRREGFVEWLTAPVNPLFARVAVNRIWQWHFGEGIHKNTSDFGLIGGRPSNQPLLDYLAAEFVAHDYSMKWLHRALVTSDAYMRSSKADHSKNREVDPENTTLWHFRLQRLDAEQVWDSILSSTGELNLAVGGKSFQLVNPDNKQSIFLPRDGTFDKENTNRRGAYIARGYIPSTEVMADFLKTFDVDDGRTPCPVRAQTVTAPQALFSMNDPLIDRAAEKLSARARENNADLNAAVHKAYRETLGRPPAPAELDRALSYLDNKPDRLKGLAWLLFNLDEFVFVK